MKEIPADLRAFAARQYVAFLAGSEEFLDMAGELFLDEGRVALRGRENVVSGFRPLLEQNRRAFRAAGTEPFVRAIEAADLQAMRALASGASRASRQLAAMLDDLREGDVLLWLEASFSGGRLHRFFNVFRPGEGGWKVIAFGY